MAIRYSSYYYKEIGIEVWTIYFILFISHQGDCKLSAVVIKIILFIGRYLYILIYLFNLYIYKEN